MANWTFYKNGFHATLVRESCPFPNPTKPWHMKWNRAIGCFTWDSGDRQHGACCQCPSQSPRGGGTPPKLKGREFIGGEYRWKGWWL